MWIGLRWQQPAKLRAGFGALKTARKHCHGQGASTVRGTFFGWPDLQNETNKTFIRNTFLVASSWKFFWISLWSENSVRGTLFQWQSPKTLPLEAFCVLRVYSKRAVFKPCHWFSGRVPGGKHRKAVDGALCLADGRFTVRSDEQRVSKDTVKKHLEGMEAFPVLSLYFQKSVLTGALKRSRQTRPSV